jgi:hypothetical protein
MSRKVIQRQIENLTRRAVGAETHAELLEQALARAHAQGAAPAPAPAAPPPPPAPPTPRAVYENLRRTDPYGAAQFLLNNEDAVFPRQP